MQLVCTSWVGTPTHTPEREREKLHNPSSGTNVNSSVAVICRDLWWSFNVFADYIVSWLVDLFGCDFFYSVPEHTWGIPESFNPTPLALVLFYISFVQLELANSVTAIAKGLVLITLQDRYRNVEVERPTWMICIIQWLAYSVRFLEVVAFTHVSIWARATTNHKCSL